MDRIEPLVAAGWLGAHLEDPRVRVVDMRGYVKARMVAEGVEEASYEGAREEYLEGHIPGAVYVDWTRDIVDLEDPIPAQVASAERFAEAMSTRGIGDDTHVVAVDHTGGQFATRLWWALRYFGHDAVSVLDGGYRRWEAEGRPLESGEVKPTWKEFKPQVRSDWRSTWEDVKGHLGTSSRQIVDARDEAQFSGRKRRGPRGGHIPGALNIPREAFFASEGGFLPLEEIGRRMVELGVKMGEPLTAYCNGGVAATVVLFNLYRLGMMDLSNYDGSWNEWGVRMDLPAEVCGPEPA